MKLKLLDRLKHLRKKKEKPTVEISARELRKLIKKVKASKRQQVQLVIPSKRNHK